MSADVTNVVHVNSGIRRYVMPGARMFTIVTIKLMAPMIVPKPEICSPMS